MDENKLVKILAIAAIIFSVIAIGMNITSQPATQIGVQGAFNPDVQPSILQIKEPSAQSTDQFSGNVLTNQKINTSSPAATSYVGEVVFLSGTTWVRADASSSATMAGKLGIVVKKPTTNTSADGQVLTFGLVRNSSWSMTKGDLQYANTTAGTFSTVKPSDSAKIQAIGYAVNTSVLYFNPPVNVTANGL